MPLLVVRLTQAVEEVDLNFGPEGFSHVCLLNYFGTGMVNGNPPLFLKELNQNCQLTTYGNLGNRVPLIFEADGTNPCLPEPLPFFGTNFWSPSSRLKFVVENYDFSPGVFTELYLVFRGYERIPRPQRANELELILMQA